VLERDRYRIYVLHPHDEFHAMSPRGEFSNENSDSLVLKIETDHASILFTGDIENEAEENLLYLGRWLKSDILKIPHHGGRTSSSVEFIKTVNPQMAVASVGRNNPFRHPHHETTERYRIAGTRLYRTDVDGAVTIIANNGRYNVRTYRNRQFKIVDNLQDEIRNLKLLF
jgi:competence protein ComEC